MDWQTSEDTVPSAPVTEADARSLLGRPPASGAWRDGDPVGDRRFATFRDFRTEGGRELSVFRIAYETWGELNDAGDNAVLVLHALTGDSHVRGAAGPGHATSGWWDDIVGPGGPIDTDRWFVVSSNMLGSSWGSTGPRDTDPRTGQPYGPAFPRLTVSDIVRAQKLLLEHLGVQHLVAVAGPSYGGYQAFQWAVQYPDFMHGIVAAISAPRSVPGSAATDKLIAELAADPNWHGGWYYQRGGIEPTLVKYRIATLKRYGIDEQLAAQFPDKAAREAEIRKRAETWSKVFDGNSLVTLRKASVRYDAEKDLAKIKAKVLYVLSRTDKVFPPKVLAEPVMAKLKAAGVTADYYEIDSDFGHSASGLDAAKWAPRLRTFMAGLEKRS